MIPSNCTLSEKDWKLVQKFFLLKWKLAREGKGGDPTQTFEKFFVPCWFGFDQDVNGLWFRAILAATPVLENI